MSYKQLYLAMVVTIGKDLLARLNEHQVVFLKLAIERVHHIDDLINEDKLNDEEKLLYLKELYSIFSEIYNIETIEWIHQINSESILTIFRMAKLIRNILAHFPLFKTWDEIWISEDMANNMDIKKKSWIAKTLKINKTKKFDLKLYRVDGSILKVNLKYINYESPTEAIYLKDMVTFKDGSTAIINLMYNVLVNRLDENT